MTTDRCRSQRNVTIANPMQNWLSVGIVIQYSVTNVTIGMRSIGRIETIERRICFYPKVRLRPLETAVSIYSTVLLVHWLQFQMTFKLRDEKLTSIKDKLQEIECKLKSHSHSVHRQQYHENKQQMKLISDNLRQIDQHIQNKLNKQLGYECCRLVSNDRLNLLVLAWNRPLARHLSLQLAAVVAMVQIWIKRADRSLSLITCFFVYLNFGDSFSLSLSFIIIIIEQANKHLWKRLQPSRSWCTQLEHS